jgi:hypothetical protein
MRIFILAMLVILRCSLLPAQKTTMDLSGAYFMQGVMETASVFELKPDSSFEFFFSQGALDRYGKGTWSVKDGMVYFKSKQRPAADFALISGKKIPGDILTVRISEKNTMILPYTEVMINAGGKILQHTTNSHGEAIFTKTSIDSIGLLFRLCPDRISSFVIADKELNYFEFRFEPWIAEVFFEGFSLKMDDKELNGRHPMLKGEDFKYVKEKYRG